MARNSGSRRSSGWAFVVCVTVAALVVAGAVAAPAEASAGQQTSPGPHSVASSARPVSPRDAARIAAAAKAAPKVKPGNLGRHGEVRSLRTAYSTTFAHGLTRTVRIFGQPVNYRNAAGRFVPIDDTLVPSTAAGYAARNAAGPYRLRLPSELGSAPVTVRLGTSAAAPVVGMSLVGASGTPNLHGASARYAGALPGVSVRYAAEHDGAKESLVLASAAAPSSTSERITVPAGDRLAKRAGGWVLRDARGATVALLPAPSGADASGAAAPLRSTLSRAASGAYTLRLSVRRAWLGDASRKFPVTIDPSVTVPVQDNTYIAGGSSANTNFGSSSPMYAGYDASTGAAAHTLLSFQASDYVPLDATVLTATLGLWVTSDTAGSATLQVYAATKPWTQSGATWNDYDGTHAWGTPGGDYQGDPDRGGAPYASLTATGTGHYVYFSPTKAVAKWLTGDLDQDGFLIKTASDSSGPKVGFVNNTGPWGEGPYLDVTYQARSGQESDQTYARYTLDDHLKLAVDVGSNDAMVSATDADIAGVGQPLEITRSYDENQSQGDTGDLASGWLFDPGPDTSLGFFADTTVYYDPTGAAHVFYPDGSGGWQTPPATNATLTHPGPDWKLKFHRTHVTDTFNADGQLTSRADHNGNTVDLHYASGGPPDQLDGITDTEGRWTTFTYTPAGKIGTVTDPAGRVTTYGYDSTSTYLTSVTDSDNGVTTYGYSSPYGYLTSITTPAGRQILLDPTFSTFTLTQVDDVAHQSGPTTTFHVARGGNPGDELTGTVTDPNGHQSTYKISPTRDRVKSATDANGHKRSQTYTANGDIATLSDAMTGPNTIKFSYDANDNLTKIQSPDTSTGGAGWANNFGYTDASHPYDPTSSTDGQGNSTTYSYDTPGNTEQVHTSLATLNAHYQGDGSTACGGKSGQLCSTDDPRGHTTNYSYDAAGNLEYVAYPSPLGTVRYFYDALSRVTKMTDGKGQDTRYSYDGLDRVTQLLTDGATTCTFSAGTCVQLSYDGDGNLLTRTDATGTTTWSYDPLGRVTSKTLPGSITSTVTYDDAGNVTSYTDPGGTVDYGYDPANNLTSLAEPGGTCTAPTSRCTTFDYDNDNHRTQTTYPSGQKVKITYDNDGRETKVAGYKPGSNTPFVSRSYDYTDTAGADTQLRQSITQYNGVTTTYSYDALNRLTAADASSGPDYTYTYDAAGNITAGSLGSHSYNAANQTSDSGFSYDDNGNLTATATGMTADYNAANQTTSITPPGGSPADYTYAGTTQDERTQAGTTSFTNDLLGLDSQTTSGSSIYFTRDPAGNLISMRQGGPSSYTSSYYTLDALGSVLRLTDDTGTTNVASYGYDPYGNTTYVAGSLATTNPYRYASGYYDTNTQLYHYGARYYQPSLGRWTQQDSQKHLGDLSQENLYTYAGDNPINNTDFSGRFDFGSFLEGLDFGLESLGAFSIGGLAVAAGCTLGPIGCAAGAFAAAGAFSGGVALGFASVESFIDAFS